MKTNMMKAAAATLLAIGVAGFAASVQAQPYYGGGYDRPSYRDQYDNNYGPPPRYRDDYRNGYNGYDRPYYYQPRPRKPSDGCLATIRATGVGNVFPGIARLNATLAWRREVQAVYGYRASWATAKNKSIECFGTRCTAKARPCRY